MKTIILCGGKGTRLRGDIEATPKPLVEIGGKPILWHIMKLYAKYGYKDFILALGYKADDIKQFFLNQKAYTCDFTLRTKNHQTKYYLKSRSNVDEFVITFVDTGFSTLIGERILRCQKYIPKKDKYFMVTYGDGVSDIDIRKLVSFHKKQKTIGTITGIHPTSKYGLIKVDGEKKINKFVEKPVLPDWVNGGFMVFDKRFFKYLKIGEMEHPAFQRLSEKKQLSMYQYEGFWHCMDTYQDYLTLNQMWTENPKWKIW